MKVKSIQFVAAFAIAVALMFGVVLSSKAGQSSKAPHKRAVYQNKTSVETINRAVQMRVQSAGSTPVFTDQLAAQAIMADATVTKIIFASYDDESLYMTADRDGDGRFDGFWKLASKVGFPVEIKAFGDNQLALAEPWGYVSFVSVSTNFSDKLTEAKKFKIPSEGDGFYLKSQKRIYGFGFDEEITPFRLKEAGTITYDGANPIHTGGAIISAAEDSRGNLLAVYLYDGLYRIPRGKDGEFDFAARERISATEYAVAVTIDEKDNVFMMAPVLDNDTGEQLGASIFWFQKSGNSYAYKTNVYDRRLTTMFGSAVGFTAANNRVFAIADNYVFMSYTLSEQGIITNEPLGYFPGFIAGLEHMQ